MFAKIRCRMPQEFNDKERCLSWCRSKQLGLKHSLRLLSKEQDMIMIRTPITNEIVEIYGDESEISWLVIELCKSDSFTYN